MRISTNKDPFNAQPVGFNDSNYQDRLFIMTASLDPNCNITKTILYSWEIAFVDRETGMFNHIYQFGKTTKEDKIRLWKSFIRPFGLQYIRCIARIAGPGGVYFLTYNFGFFELVEMKSFKCEVTSRQDMATLDKFTLNCKGGYTGKQAVGYTVRTRDSSDAILVLSEWRSPNGTVTLPPRIGNPMEDYEVQVHVEAKYLSMPPLFDDVVVKVGRYVV